MRLVDSFANTVDFQEERQVSKSDKHNLDALIVSASKGHNYFCIHFIDEGEHEYEQSLKKLQSMKVKTVARVEEIRRDGLFEMSYTIAFSGRKNLLELAKGITEYFAVYTGQENEGFHLEPIYESKSRERSLFA